jgi:hypothetical protein
MSDKKQDETIPGGKYIQGENYVNADGEIIGKVKEEKPKAEVKADKETDK